MTSGEIAKSIDRLITIRIEAALEEYEDRAFPTPATKQLIDQLNSRAEDEVTNIRRLIGRLHEPE